MAILKHFANKNSDYGDLQRYLLFECEVGTHNPVRDAEGNIIPRKGFIQTGINCDPFTFSTECLMLNRAHGKNRKPEEIKTHHFIISFDPKDVRERGLTAERVQALGEEFARYFFDGHQALVVTHPDGRNHSGNMHCHIVINSLRKNDILWKPFIERGSDQKAGRKHHLTQKLLNHMLDYLDEMCVRENLHTVDRTVPAEKHITDQEYHARARGQAKLDERNAEIRAAGFRPRRTEFDTVKDQLRKAIDQAGDAAASEEEFRKYLRERHKITVREHRGRYSYLLPDREKPIAGRALGAAYEKVAIQVKLWCNAQPLAPHRPEHTALPRIFLIRSDLRLVVDLQNCVKAQQSRAYARKVEISNLQQKAKALVWLQTNRIQSIAQLDKLCQKTETQCSQLTFALDRKRSALRKVNRQLSAMGKYLSGKKVYERFLSADDKAGFRAEYRPVIDAYEGAVKVLRMHYGNNPYPSIQSLRDEKARLKEEISAESSRLKPMNAQLRQMKTVQANIEAIFQDSRAVTLTQTGRQAHECL